MLRLRCRATKWWFLLAFLAQESLLWHLILFLPKASAAMLSPSHRTLGNSSDKCKNPMSMKSSASRQQFPSIKNPFKQSTLKRGHDHRDLRLYAYSFARIGRPHCLVCGREIKRLSQEEILATILETVHSIDVAAKKKEVMGVAYDDLKIKLYSPVVVGRKGEYYQLLYDLLGKGYTQVKLMVTIKNFASKSFSIKIKSMILMFWSMKFI
jgi:hypothetical protein